MLESIRAEKGVQFQVVALDPNGARREKMTAMVETIYGGLVPENVSVADLDAGKDIINSRTNSLGCNAVLEVSQGPSKLAFSQCLPTRLSATTAHSSWHTTSCGRAGLSALWESTKTHRFRS